MKNEKNTLYPFPTIEDRNCAELALTTFLRVQNGASRAIMLLVLKAILKKYHLTKLKLNNCIVETNERDCIVIKPKKFITDKNCPNCNEAIYSTDSKVRIISICEGQRSDFVTYGCQCGEVFGKVEVTSPVT
ncbi:hypothetical protein [Desulfofalx alkaliphila]|uniref:hypothetical protein n=1 Tax=Desulfofalx alkaliphila TaxID=105483 RepID=UPI0004E186A0|nr:hypothetical protein [Desulfofalx alkaliphila]